MASLLIPNTTLDRMLDQAAKKLVVEDKRGNIVRLLGFTKKEADEFHKFNPRWSFVLAKWYKKYFGWRREPARRAAERVEFALHGNLSAFSLYSTVVEYLKSNPSNFNNIKNLSFEDALKYVRLSDRSSLVNKNDTILELDNGFFWHESPEKGTCPEWIKDLMQHCGVDNGGYLITLFDSNYEPHVTLTWKKEENRISQIRGKQNDYPKERYWPHIAEFIKQLKVYPGTGISNAKLNQYMRDAVFEVPGMAGGSLFQTLSRMSARKRSQYRYWYRWRDGQLHRENGPAIEFIESPEHNRYYLDGREYSKEEWEEKVKELQESLLLEDKQGNIVRILKLPMYVANFFHEEVGPKLSFIFAKWFVEVETEINLKALHDVENAKLKDDPEGKKRKMVHTHMLNAVPGTFLRWGGVQRLLLALKNNELQAREVKNLNFDEAVAFLAEKERANLRKKQIEKLDSESFILKFDDGFSWYDTNDFRCEEWISNEMGHCGADERGHLQILFDKKMRPHGTMTWEKEGDTIEQAVGKQNRAPDKKYWKYFGDFINKMEIVSVDADIVGGHQDSEFSEFLYNSIDPELAKKEKITIDDMGTIQHSKGGKWHREDGPARYRTKESIEEHGSLYSPQPEIFEQWWIDGKMHRDDGPAYFNDAGEEHWMQRGKFHRDQTDQTDEKQEAASTVLVDVGGILDTAQAWKRKWYVHGELHRENDLPAILWPKRGDGSRRRDWYHRGRLHRMNGPAIQKRGERGDVGYRGGLRDRFYLFGKRVGRKQHAEVVAQIKASEEKKLQEDIGPEWHKKVYAKDTINKKDLIGHTQGAENEEHVDKGKSFSDDPPPRASNKNLSAPPAIAEEIIGEISKPAALLNSNLLKKLAVGDKVIAVFEDGLTAYGMEVLRPGVPYEFVKKTTNSFVVDPPIRGRTNVSLENFAKVEKNIDQTKVRFQIVKKEGKTIPQKENKPVPDKKQEKFAKKAIEKYVPQAPDDFINVIASGLLGNGAVNTAPEIVQWFKKLLDMIVKLLGGGFGFDDIADELFPSNNRPIKLEGAGNALIFGDSQVGGGIGRAFKEELEKKGYKLCSDCKMYVNGSSIRYWAKNLNLKYLLEEKQPNLIVISLGGNGGAHGARKLVNKIKELVPKARIIWSGPPPAVSTTKITGRNIERLIKSRQNTNNQLKQALGSIFIDPARYMTDYKSSPDGLHVPYKDAKKYVSRLFAGQNSSPSVKVKEVDKISRRHGRVPKGKLPEIVAAIREAGARHGVNEDILMGVVQIESGFNPHAKSPTGAKGLFQFIGSTGRAHGLMSDSDFYSIEMNADAGARLYKKNLRAAARVTGAAVTEKTEFYAYIAHNQGMGGLNQIVRSARSGGRRKVSKTVLRNMNHQGSHVKAAMARNPGNPAQAFLDFFQKKWDSAKPRGVAIANSASNSPLTENQLK